MSDENDDADNMMKQPTGFREIIDLSQRDLTIFYVRRLEHLRHDATTDEQVEPIVDWLAAQPESELVGWAVYTTEDADEQGVFIRLVEPRPALVERFKQDWLPPREVSATPKSDRQGNGEE